MIIVLVVQDIYFLKALYRNQEVFESLLQGKEISISQNYI